MGLSSSYEPSYTITGFNSEGPVTEKAAQGNGIGGFIALSPELTHAPETLYVHTIGHCASHEPWVGRGARRKTTPATARGSTTPKPAVQAA